MAFSGPQSWPNDPAADELPTAIKILVAGGFGAGKTTLVSTISEIASFHTEEALTQSSVLIDSTAGVEAKQTTTVTMDFGRITIHDRLSLFLFGTPGQDRFWFMWDELAAGALCAVVLADPRRLADSFIAVDYFEARRLPFVVAVNCFDGAKRYTPDAIRAALSVAPGTPVLPCDARQYTSVKNVLVSAVEYVLDLEAVK